MNSKAVFRPAAERFHSQLNWLDSWHSFSFGSHQDPNWRGFGPLRVINDDTIAAGQGFGMHPHRDMEIITVMVEGELTHADSMGHSEVLRAGEVQRMSAGTGIMHSEINRNTASCRLLQIWIEPAQQGIQPAYEQRQVSIEAGWTTLISPNPNHSAMSIARSASIWRARPRPNDELRLPNCSGSHFWLQMIEGQVTADLGSETTHCLRRGDGLGWQVSAFDTLHVLDPSQSTDLLLIGMQ